MSVQELERKINKKREEIAETEELIESLKRKLDRAKEKTKTTFWSNGNQLNIATGNARIVTSYGSNPQEDVERLEKKIRKLENILYDEKHELKQLKTDLDFERKREAKKRNSSNSGSSDFFGGGLFGGGGSNGGGFFRW